MKSREDQDTDEVEKQFERDYARMTSPVFTWLAWLLSCSVPHKKGFGPFKAEGKRSLLSEFTRPYMPTPEESEKYWDAKMLSEYNIDACTLYGPDDYWWWQQLKVLQEQSAEKKRFDRYLTRVIVVCIAGSLAVFAIALVAIQGLK
jgi:hypothetical protein